MFGGIVGLSFSTICPVLIRESFVVEREQHHRLRTALEVLLARAGALSVLQLLSQHKLFLTGEVKEAARERTPRLEIWFREEGKCKQCSHEYDFMIVGHVYHNGKDYNHLDNLRLHCFGCETLHHLTHVGCAHLIGMEEKENIGTTFGLLVGFLKYSEEDFLVLYQQHIQAIDDFLRLKRHTLESFLNRYRNKNGKSTANKLNNASYHIELINAARKQKS